MVKVAYVTMQFPVASEAFAAVELHALRRLGNDVTVLTYRSPPKRAAAMLLDRGLQDLPIDQAGFLRELSGLLLLFVRPTDSLFLVGTVLRSCWRHPLQVLKGLALVPRSLTLIERLEKLRPDIVHLFWGHYPSLLGLLVKRNLPGTVVSQFLGAYDLEERFPLSAVLARQADLLLTHAKANLRSIAALGLGGQTITVSYRGIRISDPPPNPRKTRFLMAVAERLIPQKQTGQVLEIFARVHKMLPEAALLVLGDGPEADSLRQQAKSLGIDQHVDFAGHVPHHEVFKHLAEAEVVLTMSQSRSERLPNAIKEAMLHRCLCLAARSPGIDELIEDGSSGVLVDPGDVDTGAGRLLEILCEPGAAAQIGALAQSRIIEKFNVDHLMAERMVLWSNARQTVPKQSE